MTEGIRITKTGEGGREEVGIKGKKSRILTGHEIKEMESLRNYISCPSSFPILQTLSPSSGQFENCTLKALPVVSLMLNNSNNSSVVCQFAVLAG